MSDTSEVRRQIPTHLCPGCRRSGVPDQMFACRGCWGRLPKELQNRIWDTVGARADVRAEAVEAAVDFLRGEVG